MIRDLVLKNRSVRKYDQSVPVSRETLVELVDLARHSASGGNRQALKFMLSWEPEKNATIFRHIGLAGPPKDGQRPSAYIIILGDTAIANQYGVDPGIAAQSILLGATEKGLGGCMVGMLNRKGLHQALKIPERYEIVLVVTIGKPNESFVFETAVPGSTRTRGWWDEQGVRHIPKRSLDELIIE